MDGIMMLVPEDGVERLPGCSISCLEPVAHVDCINQLPVGDSEYLVSRNQLPSWCCQAACLDLKKTQLLEQTFSVRSTE